MLAYRVAAEADILQVERELDIHTDYKYDDENDQPEVHPMRDDREEIIDGLEPNSCANIFESDTRVAEEDNRKKNHRTRRVYHSVLTGEHVILL